MSDINQLLAQIQLKVQRTTIPIDDPIDPAGDLESTQPILYTGNLDSQLCFFACDLGNDELDAHQPLYGVAGQLIRQGLYYALQAAEPKEDKDLQMVLDHVLFTNTVPYKPLLGNIPYSTFLKQRFRPFLEELLVLHWRGSHIITLGHKAFNWFSPYAVKGSLKRFYEQPTRYTDSLQVTLHALDSQENIHYRKFTLLPLPNPARLDPQDHTKFSQLLDQRLARFFPSLTSA